MTKKPYFWLMSLILLAAALRWWQFPHFPPGFRYDEAYYAVDGVWLWKKAGTFWAFTPGNNGRAALFQYLAGAWSLLLGHTVFAVRLTPVLAGILSVPLTWRWVMAMFAGDSRRRLIALCASAGVAAMFWLAAVTRSGFRASLTPFFFILTACLFWVGWQKQSLKYIIGAGVSLGLSQYTYWSALLFPLPFGLLVIIYPLIARRNATAEISPARLWRWIGLMALVSAAVFAPLGWVFWQNPALLGYISESAAGSKSAAVEPALIHWLNAVRIVLDAPPSLWQGDFSAALVFDWVAFAGFWIGLVAALRRLRQPAYLFLLASLVSLWLTAPLGDMDFSGLRLPALIPATNAVGVLRLVSVAPVYAVLAALGWVTLANRLARVAPRLSAGRTAAALAAISVLANGYILLGAWPRQPMMYEEYHGSSLALAQTVTAWLAERDVLLPFYLYAHPVTRFILGYPVTETPDPPALSRPAMLVTTPDTPVSSYVWLSRAAGGKITAFLTPPLTAQPLIEAGTPAPETSFDLRFPLVTIASVTRLDDLAALRPQLTAPVTANRLDYAWDGTVALVDYQLAPAAPHPGDVVHLSLIWRNLTDQPLTRDIFIHLINAQGEGVAQIDGLALTDGHRWRAGQLAPVTYALPLPAELPHGPYFIRVGLFTAATGQRLPVSNGDNPAGDEALLGPLYLGSGQPLPPPQTEPALTLGDTITLAGLTLPDGAAVSPGKTLPVTFYWRATGPIPADYTVFIQLLTASGNFAAGFDAQPFNGMFPTSRWVPNEVIMDTVNLPIPADLPPGAYRLIAGMYRLDTGARLPVTDPAGNSLGDYFVIGQ